ncbi:MAG: hypothetical protein AAFU65_11785 [Pseudomonadota bacterium]
MSGRKTPHPLEESVTDYINGQLPEDAKEAFERAMAGDQALRDIVDFERSIKRVVRQREAVTLPRFAGIEQQIDRSPLGRPIARPALWMPAAACLVVAIAIGTSVLSPREDDSYRTLTSGAVAYETAVVRIVTTSALSPAERDGLFERYDLRPAGEYPEANTIDAYPADGASLSDLVARIKQDERILTVRVVDAASKD